MALWWIGNILLLLVVAPVLVALLNRVLAALERIRGAADDILVGGVQLAGDRPDRARRRHRRRPLRRLRGQAPPAEVTTRPTHRRRRTPCHSLPG